MDRTTVMLPAELKLRASEEARRRGVSLGEFVRTSLDEALNGGIRSRADDPLFSGREVFGGEVPSDLSENHDEYLYGDKQ